jgi:Permuted papain-like amidase enzyme, YaeF/YiiX, C92 family
MLQRALGASVVAERALRDTPAKYSISIADVSGILAAPVENPGATLCGRTSDRPLRLGAGTNDCVSQPLQMSPPGKEWRMVQKVVAGRGCEVKRAQDRRRDRAWLTMATTLLLLTSAGATPEPAKRTGSPLAETLQSGDLLWPKKPNSIIPYNASSSESGPSDEAQWSKERDQYLAGLAANPALSPADRQRFELLKDMSYRKFLAVFGEGEAPQGPSPYGGLLGVGHTAIVRVHGGKVTIVEAVWSIGVREIAYVDWVAQRQGEWIWHGRLKDVSAEKRAEVAERAAEQIAKPYNFWNFDLADESGFYCSKLAWLSILKATKLAADDRPDPKRLLWLSPKQLLLSTHLTMLQDPGKYGRRQRG